MNPEEKDVVLLGYKYNIDRSWFIEKPKGTGHHLDLPVYLADVIPEKQMLYIKYLSELFDIFDKYDLNEANTCLSWSVIYPNSPYIWDFFDHATKEDKKECSKYNENEVENLLESLFG